MIQLNGLLVTFFFIVIKYIIDYTKIGKIMKGSGDMRHKKKLIFSILISILLLSGICLCYFIKSNKVYFVLKHDNVVKDYSITLDDTVIKGILYEQDVLYSGKVTKDNLYDYIDKIDVPNETIMIKVKFYEKYDEKSSEKSKLDYEIAKNIKIN